MTSTAEFENLTERPESSILDFSNDQGHRKTAEFVKDISAFTNTIRTDSAFIIIGIKKLSDQSKEFMV